MLYDEFVKGTGCRENEHNYQVFKRLEIVYMNDDSMTKDEVYAWGKKLVNNDLSDEQKAWNEDINSRIARCNEAVATSKNDIARYQANMEYFSGWEAPFWKKCIREEKENLKRIRRDIRELKSMLYT